MKSGPVLDGVTGLACGRAPSTSEIRLLPSRTPIQSYAVALGRVKEKQARMPKIYDFKPSASLLILSWNARVPGSLLSPGFLALAGGRSLSAGELFAHDFDYFLPHLHLRRRFDHLCVISTCPNEE